MTIEEATAQVNELPFPAVSEADVVWYPTPDEGGYRFVYQNGAWVHQAAELAPVEE